MTLTSVILQFFLWDQVINNLWHKNNCIKNFQANYLKLKWQNHIYQVSISSEEFLPAVNRLGMKPFLQGLNIVPFCKLQWFPRLSCKERKESWTWTNASVIMHWEFGKVEHYLLGRMIYAWHSKILFEIQVICWSWIRNEIILGCCN